MKKQTMRQFLAQLKTERFSLDLVNTVTLSAIFLIGFFIALPYFISNGVSLFEVIYGIGLLFWGLFSITAYMHRLIAHNCSKSIHFLIHILGNIGSVLAIQNDTGIWAGHHRIHHSKEDKAEDPYSPMRSNNILIGAMWSHFLTYFFNSPHHSLYANAAESIYRKYPITRWFMLYYLHLLVLVHIAMPLAIGFTFFGSFEAGLRLLAIHFVFVALLHQITWTVNSVTHIFGHQMGTCSAKNTWWYFAPMGEGNYHSGHHMFPYHYRNGSPWYIFDPTGWLLWTFEKVGLVGELTRKPRYELQSRLILNYQHYLRERYPAHWEVWQKTIEDLRNSFDSKTDDVRKTVIELQKSYQETTEKHLAKAKEDMQEAYKLVLTKLKTFEKQARRIANASS